MRFEVEAQHLGMLCDGDEGAEELAHSGIPFRGMGMG
jgi:hypothetical protein